MVGHDDAATTLRHCGLFPDDLDDVAKRVNKKAWSAPLRG
jgi:hypothetical protein